MPDFPIAITFLRLFYARNLKFWGQQGLMCIRKWVSGNLDPDLALPIWGSFAPCKPFSLAKL